ncbi:hypothetical protein IH575_01270, partial [Candidatus Dojkabacteria bacterium]|nr:hypothetical protein [Candidatus Dojkabacteria bacterium]
EKILKILDTGAGPATCLGKVSKDFESKLSAVDALGDLYSDLYVKYNIIPPIITELCDSEELLNKFELDSFDIVHNRNALDHSYNPIEGISQMLSIVRKGGAVILLHEENEGVNEGYWGMHQWNFTIKKKDFVIWNREGFSMNITKAFANSTDVDSSIIQMGPARLIQVIFYKKIYGPVKPGIISLLKTRVNNLTNKFKR